MNAEISWDLIMSEDMPFVEGCYRLQGSDWQVVTAGRASDACPAGVRDGIRWTSGVTGMTIGFSDGLKINARTVLELMSASLGVTKWVEVHGPDSMMLR
jgi:hypothetical protein